MDASMSGVDRPPLGGASGSVRHRAVWVPAATHPRTPPVLPVEQMLLVVDGRDNGRAWVPGSVRTVRVGRDVTGSALSWSTCLGELREAGRFPRGIVVDLPASTTSAEHAADLVLPLLRALSCSTGPHPLRLAFLATGRARPELSAALGAVAQVAGVEDGRLSAVSVRVEALPGWARDPFHVTRAELALPRPGLAEVRYTGTGREVRVLRAHDGAGPAASAVPRRGGRYLVGAGPDGSGERLAHRLVRELGACVVLLGADPDAEPEGPRSVGAGRGVLVRVGGRVSRYPDVRVAVQSALRAFGGLDGVVHCPGGGERGLLGGQSAQAARETVADAVSGATHLDRATARLPLEFFVLAVDADPYQAVAGASVPAAVGRAFGSVAAARSRLAATGARHGTSLAVCHPGALADLPHPGRGSRPEAAGRAA
ncbi:MULTISPECIES: KR domain-containing protein [unclassified Streptomyces]|uniref:KR domain-containing protein n=1 Tax=unclassified Streptomyces TaxID=2593676 RepID=UPI0036EBF072